MTAAHARLHAGVAAMLAATLVVVGCAGGGSGDGAASAAPPAAGGSGSIDLRAGESGATASGTTDSDTSPSAGAATAEADAALAAAATKARSRAEALVAKMSLAERAGQTIVATYAGSQAPVSLVRSLHLGGVIVMGENVANVAAVRRSNEQLQRQVRRPLVVAVDQEGGIVARVGAPATEFPTFMSHGAADDAAVSRNAARASGRELVDLGFTMVFAPVADVTMGPSDPTIGSRSASSRPLLVSRVVEATTAGYREAGIVPVLKHFPGHGSVPADSHLTLPVQRASLPSLRRRDLVPFARSARAGAPAVMVAHIDVRAVDPGVPSSLSRPMVTGLLRDELGFDGLVVTDSLGMAAIAQRHGSGEAAVLALRAGGDLLLMPPNPAAARAGILDAVRDGRLSRARVTDAATSVLAAVLAGEALAPAAGGGSTVGRHQTQSTSLSRAAVTIVSGPCRRPLVRGGIVPVGGTSTDRARLAAAARAAGLAVGSGATVTLLAGPTSTGSGDVVVALDAPYGLAGSSASVARVALYGRSPGAFRALVDVLTGEVRATGILPVSVPGVPRTGCGA